MIRSRRALTRPRRRAAALLVAAGLLAGCGLPLEQGVRTPGSVPAQPALPQPIGVLPPDPLPGVPPAGLVEGFLAAQTSAREGHRIARGYLAAEQRATWKDGAGVTVYDPLSVTYSPSFEGGTAVVTVRFDVVGVVGTDGAAYVQAPVGTSQTYRMHKDAAGQWRLVDLPDGLTLTPDDRDRSYSAADVYFLAPAVGDPQSRHLVADRLLLPHSEDRAQRVVERLLAGPSAALASSAETAVPAGTRLLSPVQAGSDGEVTVNLSGEAAAAGGQQRQNLAAQLFWTLRPQVAGFNRLRLLVEGRTLVGSQSAQARQAWAAYDPNGPRPDPPAYALVNGSLDALDQPASSDRAAPLREVRGIVDAAIDPRLQTVAALVEAGGVRTLRIGPLSGQSDAGLARGPSGADLRSPSWGSAERGVWLLRTGPDPALLVVRPDGTATQVEVPGMPALGPDPVLRVSRDGVRVALVADRVLYVGRFEPTGDGRSVRAVDLRPLASRVLDVAWQTGTTLVVLVADTEAPRLPLERLSIDGTAVSATGLLGVAQGEPVSVAASGKQPLLVETVLDTKSQTYRGDDRRGFEEGLDDVRRPFYPG